MQIIKTIYELIKKHWMLFCISLIALIVIFYPTNTRNVSENYSNYIKSEEGRGVGTSPQTAISPEEDMKNLSKGEIYYMQKVNELYQKYPWYRKIPITKGEYIVDYDFQKNSFRIVLRISETSPEAQKNSAINSALQDIKNIGADPTNHYVMYAQ